MAFGIRKINHDGKHYNFQWPLEVGAIATAPDWNPEAVCGGGLHFCKPTGDDLNHLIGELFAVIEYDEDKVVDLNGKHKVESCKIVHLSESPDGLIEFFKDVQFDSVSAYRWVRQFGDYDREHMKQFVTDSEHAYLWAYHIGDTDHMRQFITNSKHAYYWARFVDATDREYMRQLVNTPEYAYLWVCNIGNHDHMTPGGHLPLL